MFTRPIFSTIVALCVLYVSGAPTNGNADESWTTRDVTASVETNSTSSVSSLFGNCSDLPVIQVVEVVREIVVFPKVEDAVAFVLLSEDGDYDVNDIGGSFLRSDDGDDARPLAKKNKTKTVKPKPAHNKTRVAKQPKRISKITLRAADEETAPTEETNGDKAVEPKKCVPAAICSSAGDCGGGKARCVGIFVGTCNCAACVTGLPCSDDVQCGGYQNACNTTHGICNCVEAHNQNGFAHLGDALLKFCNHQQCDADKNACLGLPCHTGLCVC